MEIRAYLSYFRKKFPLYFWRTLENQEVDFIIDNQVAIEVKTIEKLSGKHLKGLRYLMEEKKLKKYYLVSQDPIAMKQEGIFILPWETFLKQLWDGGVV